MNTPAMTDERLAEVIHHLSAIHPQEHPGLRAGAVLGLCIELQGYREREKEREQRWEKNLEQYNCGNTMLGVAGFMGHVGG